MSANQVPDSHAEQRDGARPEEAGAAEALRASEVRYRRLFESAKGGILILDAETGMVLDANPYLLDLLGYSRTDVLQKRVWDLGYLEDVVANEDRFSELRQTDYVRYDNLALEGHDGRRHEVEFVSNVYPEGDRRVIQCNIRDISERKRNETRINHLVQVLRAMRSINQLITSEKDKVALVRRACEILTETQGYDSAWIATVDANGRPLGTDDSGIGAPFDVLRAAILGGQLPACAQRAWTNADVMVVGDPRVECGACPLAQGYAGGASLTTVLAHGSRNYGVLTVALPHGATDVEEERALVKEVALDLGLALHALDLEAEHRAAEVREAHLKQVLLAIRNVNQLIVQEEDPQRLITRACGNLTETLGYTNAWIALLDGDGRTVSATASAGLGGPFDELCQRLARGEFSACMKQALGSESTVLVNDPPVECTDCPLAEAYGGRAGFIRQLAFQGRTYGILAASVPAALAHDAEEKSLFNEVADDLGFALHKIELRTRLRETDAGIRAKLNALLAPEGDVGELSLADVLDVPSIQAMMDNFLDLTGIGVAILDAGGKVLVATGWQDICTKFHRVHPETRKHCLESDTELTSGVEPGTFKFYRCKNHLWDVATPIMLGGRHAGNVFFGQLFFAEEAPDREVFRAQARQCGFDEEEYLAAMDRVPRWTQARVRQIMTFYADFARHLSDLSYGNIRLARTLAQRDALLQRLGHNEERMRLALKATNDVVWDWDIVNDAQQWNETGTAVFGWTDIVAAPQTAEWWLDCIHPEDRTRVKQTFYAAVHDPDAGRWSDEYRFRRADGAYAIVADRGDILRDADGRAVRMIGAMLDITERKRTEEALRESEARFRFIVDHSYDLIWTLQSDGVFSYASPSWKTRLGHEPSSIVGNAFQPIVHPDDLAACEAYMARVFEARGALPGPQYRVRHADGSWRWHEASMTPVYAPDGSFMYFVGVSRDITGRKRAEDALRESEARFRSYVEHAPYGVFVADGHGRYVDVNPAAERITRYSAAELLSMSIPELLTSESRENGLNHFRTLVAEGRASAELGFRRADDSLGYWTVSATRIGPDRFLGFVEDTTERKEREERIALLGRMLDDAPAAITIHDNEGRFHFSNRHNWLLHGYGSEKEFLGIKIHRLDVPESESLLSERFRRITERGEARFEVVHYHKDGTTFPLEVTAKAIQWQGRPAVLSIASNITERKHAEEMLWQSRAILRAVLDNIPARVFWKDRDLNFLGCNLAFAHDAGFEDPEQLVGKDDFAMGWCSQAERYRRDDREVLETGSPKLLVDEPQSTPWGGTIHLLTSKVPLRDAQGSIIGVLGTYMDVSVTKRAEQALRESEERFRAANDASLDALLLLSSERNEAGEVCDFVFVDANRRTEEMLRMSRDELLGKRLCEVLPINREAGFFEKYKRVVDTGIPLEEEFFLPETHVPAAWYYHQVVKVHDGIFICHRDIGERKRAEAEHEALQSQLRQAQKMEAVGRLAGGVAHDFNNMLGIIIGNADMLLQQIGPDQPFHADLTEIRRAGARSADLTRQLLAFARKQTVTPKVIDLNDTVEGMLKMLHRLIGEDIDMAWIPGEKVWPVKIDPGQVDQILANLCVNARDAIAGVGKLTIETSNTVFDTAYCRDHADVVPGEYAVLAVSDNGCGMDSETISHLFEPFFTTKELGKGTGLGLATVYGVVKQNNGLIHVCSEPGQGTTFKVFLPRHLSKTASSPEEGSKAPNQRGHEIVLLVEDEPGMLKLTARMLEREGYTVVRASTPGEAIRLANEHAGDIHLLLTDVVMPEMNGRDLAKSISSLYPRLRCLFMSGFTANVIAHHGVLDRGVNFIQKPFSIGELTVKVREVLDRE